MSLLAIKKLSAVEILSCGCVLPETVPVSIIEFTEEKRETRFYNYSLLLCVFFLVPVLLLPSW